MGDFKNSMPLRVVCSWCREQQKIEGTWVPLTEPLKPMPGISHGICPKCEKRWTDQEKNINDEIKKNERDLKASLPKITAKP